MTDPISALELTRELVRFDTLNPPGEERACADHLARLLEAGGLEVARFEFAERRTSLLARLAGGDAKPPICFTGHIDTVPLGAKPWSMDPLAGELAQGRIYGRGTSDMKAGVAAFSLAALRLARGPRPEAGLVLVITAGEETGCEGAYHLAGADALGAAGAIVVAEPTSNYPLVGHKGALWLEAETEGVSAHGSMPERGVNAIYEAARGITKLEDFDFNLAPHALLGRATLNVGTVAGGLNLNSVPDRAEFTVDLRTLPGQSHAELRDGLARLLGPRVALRALVDVASVATDAGDPWVREVFDIMAPFLGEAPGPRGAPYFTDAAALVPAYGGAPTVILGPGEMAMAHQTDEYCVVERIDQAVEAFEIIARRWCGA